MTFTLDQWLVYLRLLRATDRLRDRMLSWRWALPNLITLWLPVWTARQILRVWMDEAALVLGQNPDFKVLADAARRARDLYHRSLGR
jgi:hypothetical protein